MKPDQLDAKLATIPAGTYPRPVPRHPLPPAALDVQALMARAMRGAPTLDAEAQRDRGPLARELLGRLPGFLQAKEIAQRVSDQRLLEAVRAWRWGAPGVLFVGPTGIGKSTAAAVLYRRLLAAGWREGGDAWDRAQRMSWFSADDLGSASGEHRRGEGKAPELTKAGWASIIFVDDAGWDRYPDAVSWVLAKRYERQLPSVVTSGKTLGELGAHYGAAVIRRLAEAGGHAATVIDCFGGGGGA